MTIAVALPSLGSPQADVLGGMLIVGLFGLALVCWDGAIWLLKTRRK